MTREELNELYGAEYPAAIVRDGMRYPLIKETRFSRFYGSAESGDWRSRTEYWISRFMDGSAAITAPELQQAWPGWTEAERIDFCQECSWIDEQPDFLDIVRCIIQHSSPPVWSAIASSVADSLPREEAFAFLSRALASVDDSDTSNLIQAIAHTRHPQAEPLLRTQLESLWSKPGLWANDKPINSTAFGVICCIRYLIELGASPADFEDRVRQLFQPADSGNHDFISHLTKYYSWLRA